MKNLVKRYGNHLAVDNLSFKVEKGQIYGFLGPNGAGKTTTMNMMTGYIAPTEGEVYINGYNIYEEPELAKKCIGYLPEQPPLYGDMKVREFLLFAAQLKNIPKEEIQENIEKVVKLTKLDDVEKRLIKNISKGYKQRVGLASAIIGFPEIIILDEPTVGLDPKQIMEIRGLIKSLGKEHTIILSSHILQEVSAVCDHVIIISHGKLVASDSPKNLGKTNESINTLEITVKADEEKLRIILEEIKEILEYKISDTEEENVRKILIKTKAGVDIRENISLELAKNKCVIFGMNLQELSLEDIFLELTNEGMEEKC